MERVAIVALIRARVNRIQAIGGRMGRACGVLKRGLHFLGIPEMQCRGSEHNVIVPSGGCDTRREAPGRLSQAKQRRRFG